MPKRSYLKKFMTKQYNNMDVEWWDSELSIVPVKPLIWLIYMYSIHMRDDKGTAWSEQKLISGTKC